MIPDIPNPWPRPRYVSAGPARFAYVALMPDAVELANRGHPLFAGIELESRFRGDDPDWFDGWVDARSRYGGLLLRTPGIDVAGISRCKVATILSGTVEDPNDLGHLQRSFLLCKLLASAGAIAVCDVESALWWPAAQLAELSSDFEFDISDHTRVVFEASEREPGTGHLCYTLGMAKFGRPDLALGGLEREHAEPAGEALEKLAKVLAEGDAFETGDVVELEGFPPLRCEEVPDDSGTPDATFGNRALWLVPEEG